MNIICKFLLFVFISAIYLHSAEISGTVKDSINHTPIVGATVSVVGTNLGAVTDKKGHFIIRDVPAGRCTLQALMKGYLSQAFILPVESAAMTIRIDYLLFTGYYKFTSTEMKFFSEEEITLNKQYHKELKSASQKNKKLLMNITDLHFRESELSYTAVFINNTNLPVYLIKHTTEQPRFRALIKKDGANIKLPGNGNDAAVFEKRAYDSTDLLFIPPGGQLKYPENRIFLCPMEFLPDGELEAEIVYSFRLPAEVYCGQSASRDKLQPYRIAFRGEIKSENTVHFQKKERNE